MAATGVFGAIALRNYTGLQGVDDSEAHVDLNRDRNRGSHVY
jgi:hypothetical protein